MSKRWRIATTPRLLALFAPVLAVVGCNAILGIQDVPVHADASTAAGGADSGGAEAGGTGGYGASAGADAGGTAGADAGGAAGADAGGAAGADAASDASDADAASDAADADAAPAVCGDGIIEAGEECDSGADGGTSRCSASCKVLCPAVYLGSGYHGTSFIDPTTHRCYAIPSWYGKKNWNDAALACTAQGGYLASVTSSEELDFLRLHTPDPSWIGALREDGGAFSWVDGEPWGFTSWASPTEPSKIGCVELTGSPRNFVVSDCTTVQSYVCEWNPEGTTP